MRSAEREADAHEPVSVSRYDLGRDELAALLADEPSYRVSQVFNGFYQAAGTLVPAFWGRQVEHQATEWITAGGFAISYDRTARQIFYPSRVLVAVWMPKSKV